MVHLCLRKLEMQHNSMRVKQKKITHENERKIPMKRIGNEEIKVAKVRFLEITVAFYSYKTD